MYYVVVHLSHVATQLPIAVVAKHTSYVLLSNAYTIKIKKQKKNNSKRREKERQTQRMKEMYIRIT